MIWGAQQYFLDMTSTANVDYETLSATNAAIDTETYWKWRIFGFFNFMWYDFWDENLAHPVKALSLFNNIHLVIIVHTIAAIPVVVKKARKEILLIAAVPILFTIMCLPFQGLARYVFPSIPCVFVLFAVMLNWLLKKVKKHHYEEFSIMEQQKFEISWLGKIDTLFRFGYFLFSIVFSMVLLYSVYIFGWNIKTEMSEYRVQRAYGVSIDDIETFDKIQSIELIGKQEFWNVANVIQLGDNTFKGMWDATPIMNITIPPIDDYEGDESIITKVELVIPGGRLFDSCTIYWTGDKTKVVSEDDVYGRFPRNAFQDTQVIYR